MSNAYFGYINAGPIRSHMRQLEKLDSGDNPFNFTFDDPAVERAYNCACIHLGLMQDEWSTIQYGEAGDRGLL